MHAGSQQSRGEKEAGVRREVRGANETEEVKATGAGASPL